MKAPGRPLVVAILAALVVALVALLAGPFVGLLTLATAPLGVLWSRWRAQRGQTLRRRERLRALPLTLDFLAIAVEAGLTPHQTIHVMANVAPPPIRPIFAEMTRRLDRGVAFADALMALPDAIGPPAAPAADALAIAHRHGTPLRDAIITLAADAARQRQVQANAAARRLPVVLSFPLVICVLPAFALIAVAPAVIAALDSFSLPAS